MGIRCTLKTSKPISTPNYSKKDRYFSNLNLICSSLLDMRNLQHSVTKSCFDTSLLEKIVLNYGFCKKLLRYKWTSDQLNPFVLSFFSRSGKKVRTKGFNWSEVHSYESNFLQNPYFKVPPKTFQDHVIFQKKPTYFSVLNRNLVSNRQNQ